VLVGLITPRELIPFLTLAKDAGSAVSGHRIRSQAGEDSPDA